MDVLHQRVSIRSLHLNNRVVMSPMTRSFSPGGVPRVDVAEYYRRRAEGGTGLIVTEGVAIEHPAAVDDPDVPHMFGADALEGWRTVVEGVHAVGGKIIPQLWHVGPLWGVMHGGDAAPMRPSGLWGTPGVTAYPESLVSSLMQPTASMTEDDIEAVINAYRAAARNAVDVGFDGVALHGGHGYLLDAFLWPDTNRRDDAWGGSAARRAAFPAAVVRAVRSEVGERMPIFYRFSQHKQQDYRARIAETPDELGALLSPLVDAGVDVLDASARRFHQPAFENSDLSLAGWAKKLTGAVTMAVGSFGIGATLLESNHGLSNAVTDNRADLKRLIERGEFDLIGIGRLHLAEPAITALLEEGKPLPAFDRARHQAVLR